MNATPEDMAAGLCAAIARGDAAFDKRGWREMPKADRARYLARSSAYQALIASTIRQAQREAYERAAGVADRFTCRCAAPGLGIGHLIRELKPEDSA